MEIIPAIDLMQGSCVRLTQGQYETSKIYSADPLALAKQFEELGCKSLHLVDLDGARLGSIVHLHILEGIAQATALAIDFSGGIQSLEDAQKVLKAGAKWATIGSLAVKQPEQMNALIRQLGTHQLMLAADVKNQILQVRGWTESTNLSLKNFIQTYYEQGIRRFFCTDISKDGTLQGPAFSLYQSILQNFPDIFLIASGGVSNMRDVRELERIGCKAVIVGKALYEGTISWRELASWNQEHL